MTDFKIEQNVPLPVGRHGGLIELIRELYTAPVGSSVFIPKTAFATDSIRGAAQRFGAYWAKTRKVTENGVEGLRIWKVAEGEAAIAPNRVQPVLARGRK